MKALDKNFKGDIAESDTDETVAQMADEIIEATRDFILKELSKNLKGYDLEPFVANLLQAMGYRVILSPHGGDSGIDITAPIKMNCRPASLSRSRARIKTSKRRPSNR